MRISHRYKFIFLSKPRCASTTMRMLLDPYSDVFSDSVPPFHHHATALELSLHFVEAGWNWHDYFSFTTVRNPWAMMVSYYLFFKPDINGIYNFEQERDGIAYRADQPDSFGHWIRTGKTYHRVRFREGRFERNLWVDGYSKLTLDNTVCGVDGRSMVNRIYKAEELSETAETMFREIGLPGRPGITRTNASEPFDYHDYYDPETRRIVAREFESDIEFGKYVY